MGIKVHEPNWDAIHDEAEKVRETEKNFRDLEKYEWEDGDNVHRLLPPYNAKGMFFKKIITHFNIKPDDDVRDCLLTWPDKFDRCPICDAIVKILKVVPELDLGRVEGSVSYNANIIDRGDEEKGPQVCRYTKGIRNWYVLQFDNRKIGDLTDIERGFDVTINKKKKKGKKGRTFVDYSPDRDPDRSPLHEDDGVIAKWLSEMYDLDAIMAPPDDDKLAELRKIAKAMERYYLKKHRQDDDRSSRRSRRDDDEDDDDRSSRRSRRDDDDDRSSRKSRDDDREESKRDDEDDDVRSPRGSERHERKARRDDVEDIDDVKPTDVPKCHASLEDPDPHSDGSVGFDVDLEKCLICEEEISCANAKKQKGL